MSEEEKRPFQILAGEDYYLTEIYKKNGKKVLYGPFPPMPDFYWFCQDEKPKIEFEKPDATVAEIVEELKKRWKESSSEKKKEYEKIAKEDKERFEDELEEAESEEDFENENKLEHCVKCRKSDHNLKTPKGKMSSFAYFVQSVLNEHKKNQPNLEINFEEFSHKCSEKWKSMSKEDKKPFQILADKDETRYNNEMEEHKKKFKDPNAPKRALSDFFWFCNEERPKVRVEQPDATVGEIAKELSKRWADCTPEQKKKYEALANKDKARYEKEMEIYNKIK